MAFGGVTHFEKQIQDFLQICEPQLSLSVILTRFGKLKIDSQIQQKLKIVS